MAHRSTSIFVGAFISAAVILGHAAPAVSAVTNVDVELGAGAFIGTGDDSDFSTSQSFVAGVTVGFGNRWDFEFGAVHGEGRNETSPIFGGPRPLAEAQLYSAGFRYYLTAEREDPNRGFLMLGYAYGDGVPIADLNLGTPNDTSDLIYFGVGLQWMLGESWGVIMKSPFYIDSGSDSNSNLWVPSISFVWRFD